MVITPASSRSMHPGVEAARSCSSLVSSAPWYVEPAIASGSFIVWLLFFRACELGWRFLLRAPREPWLLAASLVRGVRRRWIRRHRTHSAEDAYPINTSRPSGRRASSPDSTLALQEQQRAAEEREWARAAADADPIEPHVFTTRAFSSLGAYWLGILLWRRLVTPVTGAGTGCPTGAASAAQLVAEVVRVRVSPNPHSNPVTRPNPDQA